MKAKNTATLRAVAPAMRAVTASSDAEAPLARAAAWDNEQLFQLISENAYYRAERRGFTPGEELADWLAAEAEVRAQRPSPHP